MEGDCEYMFHIPEVGSSSLPSPTTSTFWFISHCAWWPHFIYSPIISIFYDNWYDLRQELARWYLNSKCLWIICCACWGNLPLRYLFLIPCHEPFCRIQLHLSDTDRLRRHLDERTVLAPNPFDIDKVVAQVRQVLDEWSHILQRFGSGRRSWGDAGFFCVVEKEDMK